MLSVAVREGAGVVNEVECVTYCLGVVSVQGVKKALRLSASTSLCLCVICSLQWNRCAVLSSGVFRR